MIYRAGRNMTDREIYKDSNKDRDKTETDGDRQNNEPHRAVPTNGK
jgi:hypothetical protein